MFKKNFHQSTMTGIRNILKKKRYVHYCSSNFLLYYKKFVKGVKLCTLLCHRELGLY